MVSLVSKFLKIVRRAEWTGESENDRATWLESSNKYKTGISTVGQIYLEKSE
jgi:hypothetical protein